MTSPSEKQTRVLLDCYWSPKQNQCHPSRELQVHCWWRLSPPSCYLAI